MLLWTPPTPSSQIIYKRFMHFLKHATHIMKSSNWGLLLLLLFFTSSTSAAWFGTKHRTSGASSSSSRRIRSDEASSSSSSSSSSPFLLNRFRSGSAVVFPVHGNVYPVGYVKGHSFSLNLLFLLCLSFFSTVFFIYFHPLCVSFICSRKEHSLR